MSGSSSSSTSGSSKAVSADGLKRKLGLYLVIFHVVGLLLSIQLTFNHFSGEKPKFCEFGQYVSCMEVQKSEWGLVLGVPAAYFGCVYFVIGLAMSIFIASPRSDDREIAAGLFVLTILGLCSVFYFVFAEYQLGVICPFCTLVHAVIVVTIFLASKVCSLRFPTFRLSPFGVLRLAWDLRIWILVGILFIGLPIIVLHVMQAPESSPYTSEQLVPFGKCLTSRRVTLYTKPNCPYCTKQKVLLGAAFEHMLVKDCLQDTDCPNIYAYPTFVKLPRSAYEEESKKGGLQAIEELSSWTRCPIEREKQ